MTIASALDSRWKLSDVCIDNSSLMWDNQYLDIVLKVVSYLDIGSGCGIFGLVALRIYSLCLIYERGMCDWQ